MSGAEYWFVWVLFFILVPIAVGAWVGKAKSRYGAGLALGLLLSWLGVLIVGLIRGSEDSRGEDAGSRSNIGVLLGVLGIAGGVGWSIYAYNAAVGGDGGIDVDVTVTEITGQQADCESVGFVLLQGRNAEVYRCAETTALGAADPIGCFGRVEDVVYDITPQYGQRCGIP